MGRRCASCHTDSFAGTKAVARIAGQREEYLVKALHDYKSGARSGGGQAAMADVAYPLSDEEITARTTWPIFSACSAKVCSGRSKRSCAKLEARDQPRVCS